MAETSLAKNKQGYGYKYTDLAQIHEYLEENNMKYYQYIQRVGEDDYIFTKRCINDKWEEEAIQGCRVVNAVLSGKSNPAQEQGSAITYARRYSLLMAFGLATEDDDAESLTKKKTFKQEPTKEQPEESPKLSAEQMKILIQTQEKYRVSYERFMEILRKHGYNRLEDVLIADFAKIGNALGKEK